jgi:hypothetical protein
MDLMDLDLDLDPIHPSLTLTVTDYRTLYIALFHLRIDCVSTAYHLRITLFWFRISLPFHLFPYLPRVYRDALELHLQSSRLFNSSPLQSLQLWARIALPAEQSIYLLHHQSTTLFKKSLLLLPLQCLELLHLSNERTIDLGRRTYPTDERTDESNQKFGTSK